MKRHIKAVLMILFGAAAAAIGLQFFLVPNHLIDGGVVGVSIISSQLLGLPLALFLVILNTPFIYLGYKKLGGRFAMYSTLGVAVLALVTVFAHAATGATKDPVLAAVFGGLIVGFGVGLVIRYGGTLDGTDTIGILIDRRTPFSVGEGIMLINIVILVASGFVLGWDNAMYSIIAYFVAHKTIDVTVEGVDESRHVWVVSEKFREIGDAIDQRTGGRVTYVNGKSSDDVGSDGIVMAVVRRFEERRLKEAIYEVDPGAFTVISGAHEIIGKQP